MLGESKNKKASQICEAFLFNLETHWTTNSSHRTAESNKIC